MPVCKICNKEKSESEFITPINGKYYYCKECIKEKAMIRYKKDPKRTWCITTLSNHKTSGYKIKITLDELYDYVQDKDYCLICGKELDWSYGDKGRCHKHNSPTLDRMNNESYITLDNIQILCRDCNVSKSDKTIEELLLWCEKVKRCYRG